MAYKIPSDCLACDTCRPLCPEGAISVVDGQYWINPALCDNCKSYAEPQCVVTCPLSLPTPAQAKRGRVRLDLQHSISPDLFINGKNHPFASALIVWEACNLLAQRHSLLYQGDDRSSPVYQRSIDRKGSITLWVDLPQLEGNDQTSRSLESKDIATDRKILLPIESFDIRAVCMHLIYAAYATTLDQPWEQEFTLSNRQIEEYLGLDKRKDLTKPAKLTLIKEIAQQACSIRVSMTFPAQGRIPRFSFEAQPLWHLLQIQHHFQDDEAGCKHLVGLTFTIRAGIWAKYFLNQQGCKKRLAFYQYSMLPKSVLHAVMSIWQQHEGAARMMVWLLFKVRIGREQRITVPTLMRIAYGEKRLAQAAVNREERKRLLRSFESDLETLNHYGLKPVFDPETYPAKIQPWWVKLAEVPDDAEAALEFWTNDGSGETRLTDASPRGKWNLLMNARILQFQLPVEWEQSAKAENKKKQHQSKRNKVVKRTGFIQSDSSDHPHSSVLCSITAERIIAARKKLGISQRGLAEKIGKSQSWIRDIENGRFCPKLEDQILLKKVLALE